MSKEDLGPWGQIAYVDGIEDIYPPVHRAMQQLSAGQMSSEEFGEFLAANANHIKVLTVTYPELQGQTPLAVLRAFVQGEEREKKLKYIQEHGYSLPR
jgi:hypothetical protein